jgi:hypothetical protein
MSAAAKFTLMCHKLSERVYYTLEDAELAWSTLTVHH